MALYEVYVRNIVYGIGYVEADNEEEAIQKAADEYDTIDWQYNGEDDEVDLAQLVEIEV
jgi:hypothetical protein